MPGQLIQDHSSEKAHPAQGDEVELETSVLIVGAGPTGLLLAHLLSRLGGKFGHQENSVRRVLIYHTVRSLLVEKYPERLGAPKAHALSPRSLEICRQFGLDTKAMRSIGSQRADAYWVNFVTSLSGEHIGVLPYERMDFETLQHTPEMIHNIPQPQFEQFVANQLSHDPQVEVRTSVGFISCVQDDQGVVSTVEERSTKNQYRIKSKHVVACDGARSQVRNFLGIASEGEDSCTHYRYDILPGPKANDHPDETMMTIHFNADLRPIVGDRVGMLHWCTDPAASGFIIAYDLSGNQVLITNFDSEKHPVESWNEELCRKSVNAAIGKEVPFDILSYRPWILSRKVAEQYSVGRVFLAGDAAHSFPPTGGLGLNSGLADVHNLAYKIAAVHQGWAGESFLETYHTERRHVAEVNSRQSVKNGKKIFSFLKALGTAGIDDVEEARDNLYKTVRDPSKQEMIKNHVEDQREHFDNLELHIGYVYGTQEIPPHASHYTPKFLPGARLPHAWVTPIAKYLSIPLRPLDISYVSELQSDQVKARQYSTLDLCIIDGFTLIVGDRNSWTKRFDALQESSIGSKLKLYLNSSDREFEFLEDGHRELFETGLGLSKGGGVLVRPDQHILMLLTAETEVQELESRLRKELRL